MKSHIALSLLLVAGLTTACSGNDVKEDATEAPAAVETEVSDAEVAQTVETAEALEAEEEVADVDASIEASQEVDNTVAEEPNRSLDTSSETDIAPDSVEASSADVTAAGATTTYTCKNGDAQRVIRVFDYDDSAAAACEVIYDKVSGSKTLWTAKSDKGFCADKAAEFAAKQVAWGWNCADQNGMAIAAYIEPTPVVEAAPVVETAPVVEAAPEADTATSEGNVATDVVPAIEETAPAASEAVEAQPAEAVESDAAGDNG